jgi:hypothetical protein
MSVESLDADFYRRRAELCHQLAGAAHAAKPLFSRLYFLAQAYSAKASAAESREAGEPSTDRALSARAELGSAPTC